MSLELQSTQPFRVRYSLVLCRLRIACDLAAIVEEIQKKKTADEEQEANQNSSEQYLGTRHERRRCQQRVAMVPRLSENKA